MTTAANKRPPLVVAIFTVETRPERYLPSKAERQAIPRTTIRLSAATLAALDDYRDRVASMLGRKHKLSFDELLLALAAGDVVLSTATDRVRLPSKRRQLAYARRLARAERQAAAALRAAKDGAE